MLIDDLQAAYKQAMIDKNPLAKEVLSSTIAAIKNKKIELQRDPSDDEIVKCIQKEVKMRSEGASFYQQAGKNQEYNDEMEKIQILEGFLPSLLTEAELKVIVKSYITKLAIDDPLKQRSVLINAIKAEYGARVDGGLLNKVISG